MTAVEESMLVEIQEMGLEVTMCFTGYDNFVMGLEHTLCVERRDVDQYTFYFLRGPYGGSLYWSIAGRDYVDISMGLNDKIYPGYNARAKVCGLEVIRILKNFKKRKVL